MANRFGHRKTRPIEREIYSDDIQAAFGLAVSTGRFRAVARRLVGPTLTSPALAGAKIGGGLGGGTFLPTTGEISGSGPATYTPN